MTLLEQALAAVPVEFWPMGGGQYDSKQRLLYHLFESSIWTIKTDEYDHEVSRYEAHALMEKCWREKLGDRIVSILPGTPCQIQVRVGDLKWRNFEAPTLVEALAEAIVSVFGKDGDS